MDAAILVPPLKLVLGSGPDNTAPSKEKVVMQLPKLCVLVLFLLMLVCGCYQDRLEEDPAFTAYSRTIINEYLQREQVNPESQAAGAKTAGSTAVKAGPAVSAQPGGTAPATAEAATGPANGVIVYGDWERQARNSLGIGKQVLPLDLENIYLRALVHSHQIKVFSDLPLIRETAIEEAQGEFDPRVFVETRYDRTDEPVGSALKTGGPARFREEDTNVRFGIRKKFITGTQVTLSQKLGLVRSNSRFFIPNPQSQARLALTVEQPLLKGGWIEYNRSVIVIARIDHAVAQREFLRQAQTHLMEVTRAYWSLYLARLQFVREQHFLDRIKQIRNEMGQRRGIDALPSQVSRTEAEFSRRQAAMIRARQAVQNAQNRLLTLLNDPQLGPDMEIIPISHLYVQPPVIDLSNATIEALKHRSEIDQAFLQIRAAAIREKITKNELLPTLNLVVEARVDGLDARRDIPMAFSNQFHEGTPSVGAGLVFEYALGNRTARARYRRQRLEKRQLINQLKSTIDTVLLEVKTSYGEVQTAYQEYLANRDVFRASQKELQALQKRRTLEEARSAEQRQYLSYFLELILGAQTRLQDAERELLRSLVAYNLALVNLRRATGTLLDCYGVTKPIKEMGADGLPILKLKQQRQSLAAPDKK